MRHSPFCHPLTHVPTPTPTVPSPSHPLDQPHHTISLHQHIQRINHRNPTPSLPHPLQSLPQPTLYSSPPTVQMHNRIHLRTLIGPVPRSPDAAQATDQDHVEHGATTPDLSDDAQFHVEGGPQHPKDGDAQHPTDLDAQQPAAITTDAGAATPPAADPLTTNDGWTPDQAHAAPQADGVPHVDALPATPTAPHPDRASLPLHESYYNLPTFYDNNSSAWRLQCTPPPHATVSYHHHLPKHTKHPHSHNHPHFQTTCSKPATPHHSTFSQLPYPHASRWPQLRRYRKISDPPCAATTSRMPKDLSSGSEKSAATPPSTGFTTDQLLAMSQMLHSAGYVPNDRGIHSIRWIEVDSLYPAMIISLHDPGLFQENKIPFQAPPPFGVTAADWQSNPPAVNCFTFVHGTSFQAGSEILREGQLRPTALPKGTRADACVVYGAATPGDISDYTVETATAQLLKRPKGRNDIIMLCSLSTTEAHYKASWSSLTDEAHVCRRRGILRNSDRWGAHAGHLHVQGLIMVGHNR